MDHAHAEVPASHSRGEVSRLTDHLFREEAGKLVAVLTGIFGIDRLQLAEDVVQEALAKALKTWPYYGIPENPAAWITQTAKNRALDVIRREKRFREKQTEIAATIEQASSEGEATGDVVFDSELRDARLRLMFACCHPLIPEDAQAALALKTLCGFSVTEIAQAFLASEAATAKRLTRARQAIRRQGIPFEIPAGEELTKRLTGVWHSLYLLFNEGYKASGGEELVREELCREAIRLTTILTEHPAGDRPRTHALLALMLLNAARLPERLDAHGNVLRLREQDRAGWDRQMIRRGLLHLARSGQGNALSEYHLQAGIAACHCTAEDYASTDWTRILALYNQLAKISPSPVVELNRAVALAEVQGPRLGIEALEKLRRQPPLKSYALLHAVLAEFEARLGNFTSAASHLQNAIELAQLESERTLLRKRLRQYEAQGASAHPGSSHPNKR